MLLLAFVILCSNHLFAIIMDVGRKNMHIMRRTSVTTEFDTWEDWEEPTIYHHIYRLHGWEAGMCQVSLFILCPGLAMGMIVGLLV